jgi:hypothetical protein
MMSPPSSRIAVAFLFVILNASSCRNEFVSEADLVEYVNDTDNGLTKSVRAGRNLVEVSWQPTDLLIAREVRGIQKPTAEEIDRARAKYQGQYYFAVRLSRNGQDLSTPSQVGFEGFTRLLETLSFEMGDKVSVITSAGDTLAVADYVYNRTYGISKSSDLLFVFRKERQPLHDNAFLELKLDEFGLETGKQVFRFEIDDINETPKIY